MAEFVQREKVEATFNGQQIKFNREWAGHRFTDAEVEDLLAGKEITITANKKSGGTFEATGSLGKGEFNGHEYWGFQLKPFEN
jgi:DNA topoisomerase-3